MAMTNGVGGPGMPTMPPGGMQPQNMTTDQLLDQLQNNKNLSPEERQALVDELLKRLGGDNNEKGDSGGGGGGSPTNNNGGGDPLQQILEKLMRGESLTPEEEKFLKDKTKGPDNQAPPTSAPTGNQV